MRAHQLPVALLAFAAMVAVIPAWQHYEGAFEGATGSGALIASLVLPAMVLLFMTSWVMPSLSRLVLGGAVVLCTLILAPWWWELSGLAVEGAVANPLAQLFIRLTLAVLVLAAVVSLGYTKMRRASQ